MFKGGEATQFCHAYDTMALFHHLMLFKRIAIFTELQYDITLRTFENRFWKNPNPAFWTIVKEVVWRRHRRFNN